MNKKTSNQRTVYMDYLRVIASFAVIIIHTVSFTWYTPDLQDFGWKVYCLATCMSRWGVPIFVMISGALFLSRNIPIKTLYSKYILRLISACLIWSAVFNFTGKGSFTAKFYSFLEGPFHMWFVPMIIGLYICTPLLKKITADDNTTDYFLILAFIFAFFIPSASLMIKDFGGGIINRAGAAVIDSVNKLKIHMVLGYTGYYVLGYVLNKRTLRKRTQLIIYALGVLGFAMTIYLTFAASRNENRLVENYFDNLTVNLLFSAAAVFVWFKSRKYKNKKLNALMKVLSKYSFGSYIVHMYVLNTLKANNFLSLFSDPISRIYITGITVFIISKIISGILNHISVAKKYIV